MKRIAVGDKVRVISGNEEGYVVSINKNIVEIEIEDGFTIPVIDKDIVVVSGAEQDHFGSSDSTISSEPTPVTLSTTTGHIYAGFTKHTSSSGYRLLIVNHTSSRIFFCAYWKSQEKWVLLDAKTVASLSYHAIAKTLFDQDELSLQLIQLTESQTGLPSPQVSRIRVKPNWFTKDLPTIPLVREEGHYFNLLESIQSEIDTQKLKEAMLDKQSADTTISKVEAPNVLDLHIEELLEDPSTIRKNDILSYQLKVFDAQFDNAIRAGRHDITVVHGVGNGTLRYNIQKRLSGHPHVAYFKDAQKEKFGYGAIYIKIK